MQNCSYCLFARRKGLPTKDKASLVNKRHSRIWQTGFVNYCPAGNFYLCRDSSGCSAPKSCELRRIQNSSCCSNQTRRSKSCGETSHCTGDSCAGACRAREGWAPRKQPHTGSSNLFLSIWAQAEWIRKVETPVTGSRIFVGRQRLRLCARHGRPVLTPKRSTSSVAARL